MKELMEGEKTLKSSKSYIRTKSGLHGKIIAMATDEAEEIGLVQYANNDVQVKPIIYFLKLFFFFLRVLSICLIYNRDFTGRDEVLPSRIFGQHTDQGISLQIPPSSQILKKQGGICLSSSKWKSPKKLGTNQKKTKKGNEEVQKDTSNFFGKLWILCLFGCERV